MQQFQIIEFFSQNFLIMLTIVPESLNRMRLSEQPVTSSQVGELRSPMVDHARLPLNMSWCRIVDWGWKTGASVIHWPHLITHHQHISSCSGGEITESSITALLIIKMITGRPAPATGNAAEYQSSETIISLNPSLPSTMLLTHHIHATNWWLW